MKKRKGVVGSSLRERREFLFLERETYFVCVAPNSNDIVVS
jgi:hypothetical protein